MKKYFICLNLVIFIFSSLIAWAESKREIKYTYFGKQLNKDEYEKIIRENEIARKKFPETVARLNAGWDYIHTGSEHFASGRYNNAIEAYKKAYEIDPRNRLYIGNNLIKTYEKVGKYDEAISVVNEILKTQPLGEYGIQKYSAIRERLIAAKAQATSYRTQSVGEALVS